MQLHVLQDRGRQVKVHYSIGNGYRGEVFPDVKDCHECGRPITDDDYAIIVSVSLGEYNSGYEWAYPLHLGRCFNKTLRRIRSTRAGYASDSDKV